MKCLELFSGTHSIGQVLKEKGWDIVSLDRDLGADTPFGDYVSENHIKCDILTWDYKKDYKQGDFDLITASPVCLWWSSLRYSWINRKCKSIHPTEVITKEILDADIERFGKPMVDKVFEILDYFKPKTWWIENPQTGRMRHYIAEKYPTYNTFYDVDYCKYSNWGYKKRTRFWTNMKDFKPKLCKMDCENVVKEDSGKKHHNIILANGWEEHDGKNVLMNTKALRDKYKGEKDKRVRKKHLKSFGSNVKGEPFMKNGKPYKQKCVGGGSSRLERYRIPKKLVEDFTEHLNE